MDHTTIVPAGDAGAILSQAILKVIIIGNWPVLVNTADFLAGSAPTKPRWVIWFKTGLPANMVADFQISDDIKAFSLSTANKVADKMLKTEADTPLRIEELFVNAGAQS